MAGIGFLELLVVGVVALVVLGPERLPGAIRTVSLWIGRLRRSFNNIKQDIEKEIGADEIRRQLRNEEIMDKFRHTQNTVQNSISAIKKETDEFKKNINLEAKVAADTSIASKPQSASDSNSTPASDPAPKVAAQPSMPADTSSTPKTESPSQHSEKAVQPPKS